MTVKEFEGWVSDNYEELAKMAKQVIQRDDAVDILHNLIESICDGSARPPKISVGKLQVGYFATALRHDKINEQVMGANRAEVLARFAASLEVLGEDTFTDTKEATKRRLHREEWLAKREASGSTPVCVVEEAAAEELQPGHLFYGQAGVARWRYQQLRDGRLFDERAVRSLAESMHRTSQRMRHFGERGYSYTEFGQEVVL